MNINIELSSQITQLRPLFSAPLARLTIKGTKSRFYVGVAVLM